VIVVWIFLIVVGIGIYSLLLVEIFTLHDTRMSEMMMNILIQVINGLFTFAAILNLPVRVSRLRSFYGESDIDDEIIDRKTTTRFCPSGDPSFTHQSTEDWEKESQYIFDRLDWSTRHLILQSLLWNSLFQIINQVFRCIYYSHELADKIPGKIYVNLFFPLAILAGVIAAMTQAIAENRFREKHSLGKKPNNFKKTMIEFWHNLWKLQTDGKVALGALEDTTLSMGLINLRRRRVDLFEDPGDTFESSDQVCSPYGEKARTKALQLAERSPLRGNGEGIYKGVNSDAYSFSNDENSFSLIQDHEQSNYNTARDAVNDTAQDAVIVV